MDTPTLITAQRQLRDAAYFVRRQRGECPHEAGRDYETSQLRAAWYRAQGEAIQRARAPILAETRRTIGRNLTRRKAGKGNRAARRAYTLTLQTLHACYCPFEAAAYTLQDFRA